MVIFRQACCNYLIQNCPHSLTHSSSIWTLEIVIFDKTKIAVKFLRALPRNENVSKFIRPSVNQVQVLVTSWIMFGKKYDAGGNGANLNYADVHGKIHGENCKKKLAQKKYYGR